MAEAIRFVLTNLPAFLFVIAVAAAFMTGGEEPLPNRLLRWLLLLPVGVASLWAGLFHVFFPEIAAQSIGWQVSPFQFEIGVADLSIGVVAVLAFWRSLPFQAAAALYTALFFAGVAVGHVREAIDAHDFAPNNFGLLLLITVVQAVLLPALVVWAGRHRVRG
ncbi:hypothetical protein MWN33_17705 [Starkeya koreensis]|uniref:DoxX family protein n=1 Tax=Ancylobacter koreensis TaxID=266121 RepID=A0ABT0DRG1_9HYPH|nr:DUF6790 family protein [Ancylobacter koreensis]MCK0209870.1 hypothetical protein [Ancylobacter koreensis]